MSTDSDKVECWCNPNVTLLVSRWVNRAYHEPHCPARQQWDAERDGRRAKAKRIESALSSTQINMVCRGLDQLLNGPAIKAEEKQFGFALLWFEFGKTEGGRVNYASNAEREDMLTAMKEFIARAEGRIQETETKQ